MKKSHDQQKAVARFLAVPEAERRTENQAVAIAWRLAREESEIHHPAEQFTTWILAEWRFQERLRKARELGSLNL